MARPKKGIMFWHRVYSETAKVGDCLIFFGHTDECGYGRLRRNGKLVRLHREVWERDNERIPKGAVIMHICDRPACIEPSHLCIGTQRDNIADMDSKGRRVTIRGSDRSTAKLKDVDIPHIRRRIAMGDSCAAIGRDFKVSEGLIRHIKKARNWSHV